VLVDPGPSLYDQNFSLFRIPVRVSPWFWLMGAFISWGGIEDGFAFVLVGIGCVFVSILLHELGHVLVGKLFGAEGYIVLYGFGGLAVGSRDVRARWQSIAVSFAGPLVQLVLYEVLWLGLTHEWIPLENLTRLQRYTIAMLLAINWYWPLLNLLPVWPLDGGMIARDVLTGVSPGQGLRWSLGISVLCAGALAVNALLMVMGRPSFIPYFGGGYWTLFLFGSLALSNYQMLQQLGPPRGRSDSEDRSWERDPDHWK
jgi:stage IV sporulation protein FB